MILGDFGAWHGHECFILDAVVWMLFSQLKDKLFDGHAYFFERHRWGHAHIQENIRAVGSAADPPGMSAADATDIHDAWLAIVHGLLLPRSDPFINGRQNFFQAENRAVVLLAASERGMNIMTVRRNPHPHRSVMSKHELHVRRLAQNAHVRQHAVVDQIVRADAIAAILLADKFVAPLRFFDFAGDGGDGYVAFKFYA